MRIATNKSAVIRSAGIVLSLSCMMVLTYQVVAHTLGVPLKASPQVVDLGTVLSGTIVTRQITVTNTSWKRMQLDQLAPSCGCTTTTQLDSLAPGERKTFTVRFNSTNKFGAIKETVRVSGPDNNERPLVVSLTGNVVPTLTADPHMEILGKVATNEDHAVKVELASFDGRAFRVGDIQAEHIRSWQSTPASNGHITLVGKFRTTEQPGEHTDRITVRTTDPTWPTFEIPVQYTVLGEYQANPTNVNLGMLPSNAVSKVSFAITGPNLSALALDKLPRNLKVHLDRTAPNVCRVTGEYTAREAAKSFVTDSIVLTTGNSRQPRIVVPFYAGTE